MPRQDSPNIVGKSSWRPHTPFVRPGGILATGKQAAPLCTGSLYVREVLSVGCGGFGKFRGRLIARPDFHLEFTQPDANPLVAAECQARGLAVGASLEHGFDVGRGHASIEHVLLERGVDLGLVRLAK